MSGMHDWSVHSPPSTGGGGASTLQDAYNNGTGVITTSTSKPVKIDGTEDLIVTNDVFTKKIHTGDIEFANEWTFTEAWNDGSEGSEPDEPESKSIGMYLKNSKGERVFMIDEDGNLHIRGQIKQM